MEGLPEPSIHRTADVHQDAQIGRGTYIWNEVQIRGTAILGEQCTISKGVYIDREVHIGNRVKVQNQVSIYRGVTVEDGVFIGPHATFTNDLQPRAISPDGEMIFDTDWQITETKVKYGASIGANATVVCGVTIGKWAMVAAGAIVTRDVPDYGLVVGAPARLMGFVGPSGHRLLLVSDDQSLNEVQMRDPKTDEIIQIPRQTYALWKQK
jgi:UDP-2-acetamido-3-amino-2,3-dideoxy-glucuronate N-acetyltransferase